MTRLHYNGLATGAAGSLVGLTLGASLTSGATSVTFNAALTYANGTAVPTIAGSDYIPLEILDTNGRLTEIVWLTAYTTGGTTGTIARGKEGTTGVAHSSGDKVVHSVTTADLTEPAGLDPAAPTDHFPGTALNAAWTLAGSYISGDMTVHDSWLEVATGRGAGSYIWRTVPAGDWTATMKFVVAGGSGLMFGILAVDNSGNGVGGGFYDASPDGPLVGNIAGGSYSSGFQSAARPAGTSIRNANAPIAWARLRKSGTNYYVSLSLNGALWGPETPALSVATTLTRIGVGPFFGTVTYWGLDYFDVR